MSSPAEAERKKSLSNICSLPLATTKVTVGGFRVDYEAEQQADHLAAKRYPELAVMTTAEGRKQFPLQQLLLLDQRFQTEIETVREQAFAQGRQAGHAAGLQEGQKEAREVVQSLSGLLSDLVVQRDAVLREAKNGILDMVLKISGKLTFGAAAVNHDVTRAIIEGAIDHLLDKSAIKIKVHPDHLPILEQQIDRFRGRDTSIKSLTMEADPRVRAGGCLIETPSGDIDARLESMYEIITQAILSEEDVPL